MIAFLQGRAFLVRKCFRYFCLKMVKQHTPPQTPPRSEKEALFEKTDKPAAYLSADDIDFDAPSLIELKSQLPAHCFRPKPALSLYYFFRDLVMAAGLFFLGRLLWVAADTSPVASTFFVIVYDIIVTVLFLDFERPATHFFFEVIRFMHLR